MTLSTLADSDRTLTNDAQAQSVSGARILPRGPTNCLLATFDDLSAGRLRAKPAFAFRRRNTSRSPGRIQAAAIDGATAPPRGSVMANKSKRSQISASPDKKI
jgi:hypothetical protein